MSQSDQSFSAYQLHIVLRRTSPHLWRRVLVRSDSTLRQLHQTIQALFGWADPHRFVLRGRFLGASPAAAGPTLPSADLRLAELQLQLQERFFYDYRFYDAHTPVWRHQVRLERLLATPIQLAWEVLAARPWKTRTARGNWPIWPNCSRPSLCCTDWPT
jgi:hypothetical protein